MKRYFVSLLVSSLSVFLLSSCGGSGSSGTSKTRAPGDAQEEQSGQEQVAEGDGTYKADFITLNSQVNGTIPGSATFLRTEDRVMIFLRIFAGGPKVWHQQAVYKGNRCPAPADDLNGDGFIDVIEGQKVYGEMLIPLDANINSQKDGKNFFPVADLSGYYHYERIGSFTKMLEDLQKEDTDPADNMTKLGSQEPLNLIGRVVVVHGVAQTVILPDTVASMARRKPFQNLPISCGVITRVIDEPGTYDDGEIPGPVADVQEGQDRPAPDEWQAPTGNTEPPTGGSNESDDGETPTSEGEETRS